MALEPAVGGQPRHRGAHHAGVDVELLEKLQQRAEPDRTAARTIASPNTVMTMEPVRDGSRFSCSMMRRAAAPCVNAYRVFPDLRQWAHAPGFHPSRRGQGRSSG